MADITNAALAAQINDLVTMWQTREKQMVAWLSGADGGGDYSNGTYPLSDYLGNTQYVASPAQMAATVAGTVNSATSQANASAASATTAAVSATQANSASVSAQAAASASGNSATQASNSQNRAANSAGAALGSETRAASSATAAAASASDADASATAANTSATSAATSASSASSSATAAAASAATVASFDPSLYRLKSVQLVDSDIANLSWGKLTSLPSLAYQNASSTFTTLAATSVTSSGGTYYTRSSNNAIQDLGDGWLRFNQSQNFGSGLYTPGSLRVDGWSRTNSGYSDINQNYTLCPNLSTYTYGSWFVSGGRNGYTGLTLNDGSRYPTFMSNGTASGVYNQGNGYWSWVDNSGRFNVYNPVTDGNGNAYLRHTSHGSGVITFSTSAPSGGADGDIWFQYS